MKEQPLPLWMKMATAGESHIAKYSAKLSDTLFPIPTHGHVAIAQAILVLAGAVLCAAGIIAAQRDADDV